MSNIIVDLLDTVVELKQQLKHQRQCTLRARESEDKAHKDLEELTREFDILEGACEFWKDEAIERGYDQGGD